MILAALGFQFLIVILILNYNSDCDFVQHWDCEGDEGSLHCHKEHLQKHAHQVTEMIMIMTMMDDHDACSSGDQDEDDHDG